MSPAYVLTALHRQIYERAAGRCEYCLLSADDGFFPHEADHIIAEKHGGATTADNVEVRETLISRGRYPSGLRRD